MEQLSSFEFLTLVAIGYLPTYLVCTPLIDVLLKHLCVERRHRYWILVIQIVFVYLLGLAILTYCPWFEEKIPSYLFIFDTSALFGEFLSGVLLLVFTFIIKPKTGTVFRVNTSHKGR